VDSSVKKEHARYLWAMFVTVLASQATMVVDAAVGGNLLGADAVSAVDLVMPVYEFFYGLVMMLGMGGCTVASMCLGRGDVVAVRRHFTAAMVSSLLVMVLLFVLAGLLVNFMVFTSMAGRPMLMMSCAIVQFFLNVSCNLLLIKVAGLGIEALAYSSSFSCVVALLMLILLAVFACPHLALPLFGAAGILLFELSALSL